MQDFSATVIVNVFTVHIMVHKPNIYKIHIEEFEGGFLVANNLNTCNSQDFEIDYKIFSNNRLSVSRTTSTSNMEMGIRQVWSEKKLLSNYITSANKKLTVKNRYIYLSRGVWRGTL